MEEYIIYKNKEEIFSGTWSDILIFIEVNSGSSDINKVCKINNLKIEQIKEEIDS